MRRAAPILTVLLALVVPGTVLTPAAHSQSVEAVATAGKPSVAAILTEKPDGFISGTGFMAGDHLVVTAYHVIEGARRILLRFPDHPPVDASVVSSDSDNDVAVLSIPALPVKPLPLGDIAQVHEGQTIVVIGFPRMEVLGAQTATITQGIVSAIRPGLLQIQAPVSPGSSGAPVLTTRGEVIGVVRGTLRGEQQALNFATHVGVVAQLLGSPPSSQPPATVPSAPPPPLQGQPAPNVGVTMTGRWALSFQVTKGNDKDRARVAWRTSDLVLGCVQNETTIICRALNEPGRWAPVTGVFTTKTDNGTSTAFVAFEVAAIRGPSQYVAGSTQCFYNEYLQTTQCYSYPAHTTLGDPMSANLTGQFINGGMIKGTWTGMLVVGMGKYPVEGTWTAIRLP